MKKIFKKLKESKIVNSIINVAIDLMPLGSTGQKIVSSIWVDKDGNGKISLNELNWPAIGGLVGVAALLRLGIVDKVDLLFAADLILSLIGG